LNFLVEFFSSFRISIFEFRIVSILPFRMSRLAILANSLTSGLEICPSAPTAAPLCRNRSEMSDEKRITGSCLSTPSSLIFLGQAEPVHAGHLDVRDHDLDGAVQGGAVLQRLLLASGQPVPSLPPVVLGLHIKAGFFEKALEHRPDHGRVVDDKGPVLPVVVVLFEHLLVQAHAQTGVEFQHDPLQIEQKDDTPFQLNHPDDRLHAEVGNGVVRGLDILPTDPVDAGYARYQKGGADLVELRDNDLGVLGGHGLFAEPDAQVHERNDPVPLGKGPQHRGVGSVRHGREPGLADDFQDLGHIDPEKPGIE
jgi:hypothetical protein